MSNSRVGGHHIGLAVKSPDPVWAFGYI